MRPAKLDAALLDRLTSIEGETLASLYLPTHVRGAEIEQDRIRLKNAISRIDSGLEEAGWSTEARSDYLSKSFDLLDDDDFWRHQNRGLAVFIDEEGTAEPVALLDDADELAHLADVFHVRPMMASAQRAELPVLVLTKGGVRLYLVSRQEARLVQADLPESFEDVNWFVDREKQRQRHPDRTGTNRSRHGHEGGYEEEDLNRFLRAVDDALPDTGSLPLVVLGDDNLAARLGNLSDRDILSPPHSGVGDVDDPSQIHEKANAVVERHEASELESTLEQVQSALGRGEAITDLDTALEAAVTGRISSLAVHAKAEPVWGRFEPESLNVVRHEHQELFAVDLLDRLAVGAMRTGAEVVVADEPMEGHSFVAKTRF